MKYQVTYLKPYKKNKVKKQTAVFYDVEHAFLWQNHVMAIGCQNVEIMPVFGENE